MGMSEEEFLGHLQKEAELSQDEARAVLDSGVVSLVGLMSLVGRGDHTTRGWPSRLVFKAERWYWALRKSGTKPNQFAAPRTGLTGGKRRKPPSPQIKRIGGGTNEYKVTSHEYGRAYAGMAGPAWDEGRDFPIIDTNSPTEIGWEPPQGWAEMVKPHPVDPQLHHPKPVQQFDRPAHHGTTAARVSVERPYHRPARSYRTSRSQSRAKVDGTAPAEADVTLPQEGPESDWVFRLGKGGRVAHGQVGGGGGGGGGVPVAGPEVGAARAGSGVAGLREVSPKRHGGSVALPSRSPQTLHSMGRSPSPEIRIGQSVRYSSPLAQSASPFVANTPPAKFRIPSLASDARSLYM